MGLFEDILHEATIDGIPFPVSSREVSGGRAFARRRYPYRDGQDTEDTGREPYVFNLTIPLYADVDSNHYPGIYESLRAAFDDPETQGEVEYVDLEYGPVDVKVVSWKTRIEAENRDGTTIEVTLEERTDDAFLFSITRTLPDSRALAEDLARLLDELIAENGLGDAVFAGLEQGSLLGDLDDVSETELFGGFVIDYFDVLEEDASDADAIGVSIDLMRGRIDVVLGLDFVSTADGWPIYQASIRLADCVALAGERAAADGPQVVEYEVQFPQSAYEISYALFGTASRASEITSMNPTTNPLFYRAGTVLRVLAE